MNYELYDILTLNKVDYVISSLIVHEKNQYFLLTEIDEEENIKTNHIKIMKRAIENNLEPDVLYPVLDETEFQTVKELLESAMMFDLKEE